MPEVLPELGALAAFAFLLLIAGALWVLQGVIRNTFGRVPVIGSWVSRYVDAALNDARNAVLRGAEASWGAGRQAMRWLAAFARNPLAGTIEAFAQTYHAVHSILFVTLPALENRVLLAASRALAGAESYAAALARRAEADAAAAVAGLRATALTWFAQAVNYAGRLVAAARADLDAAIRAAEVTAANDVARASAVLGADIAAAEHLAAAEVANLAATVGNVAGQLSHDIAAGVAGAEALAAANLAGAVRGIVTDLDTWGTDAVRLAWPDASGDLAALRQALGGDFPWLNDLLGALGGLGAAGLLGTLIRSMATSQAMTRLATDCVVPNCRDLSGLGRDLANLLGTASTAAMLAWLIFAVTDPAGWAAEAMAVAAPVATQAADAATRLFQGG